MLNLAMLPLVTFPAAQSAPMQLAVTPPPVNPAPEVAANNLLFQAVASNQASVAPYNNVAPRRDAATGAEETSVDEIAPRIESNVRPSAAPFAAGRLMQPQTALSAMALGQGPRQPPFSISRSLADQSFITPSGAGAYAASLARNAEQLGGISAIQRI